MAAFDFGVLFYIFSIIGKKHLVIEWLPYKSGVINSNISETSKDRPNTPPSVKFLEQRIHELVWAGEGSSKICENRPKTGHQFWCRLDKAKNAYSTFAQFVMPLSLTYCQKRKKTIISIHCAPASASPLFVVQLPPNLT